MSEFEAYLPHFAVAIALGLAAVGVSAMAFPKWAADMFGISAAESARPYVVAAGARDVFIAVAILLVWMGGDVRLLAKIVLATALISITDTVLVLKRGSKPNAAIHLLGTAAVVLYGCGLLILF